jgi:O-antigen/teichoic acid export membrane protein
MNSENSSIEENSRRQVKAGAVVSYVIIIIQILITLLFTPWLSSYLGTSNYGLYTLGSSLAGIFMLDLGLSAATSKFLSEYRAAGDRQKEADFLGVQCKLYFIIDLVIFVVALTLFFFLRFIYQGLTDSELGTFQIIYIIVCGYSILSTPLLSLNGILTANESFLFLKLTTLIQRLLSVGAMCAAILLNLDVIAIMLCYTGSSLLVSLIKILYVKFKCGSSVNLKYRDKGMLKSLFAFSIWIALITIAQRLTASFVPQILGMVHDTKSVAVYGFASQLETYTFQITTVVAGMFMPKIARIMNKDPNDPSLYKLFVKIGKFQMIIIGLIFIGFVSIGRQFVVMLMGGDYEESYLCAVLLIAPSFLSVPKTPMESHCYLTNNIKFEAIITIVDSVVAFAFYFLFGTWFGAIGVAAVYCVSSFLCHLLVDIFVYGKKQGIPILKFFRDCYLPFLVIGMVVLSFGIGLSYLWPIQNWKILICQALIIVFVYALPVWFFYFSKNERKWAIDSLWGPFKNLLTRLGDGKGSSQNKSVGKVWYIACIDDGQHQEEKRISSPACYVKVKSITKTLLHLGYQVYIVSPSASQARSGLFPARDTSVFDGATLHSSRTRGFRFRLFRGFNYFFTQFRSFVFLLWHMPKRSKVIVYHSMVLLRYVRWLVRLKKVNLILEVEEVYGDVKPLKNKEKKRELSFIAKANGFIFCSDFLRERFDPTNRMSAMIYGNYSFHGSLEPNTNKIVYAGSLDEPKGGARLALEASRFLDCNYSISFLLFGTQNEIDSFAKRMAEIQAVTLCKLDYSSKPLLDSSFTAYLNSFHVGMAAQTQDNVVNSSSFPSKILAYLACNLNVVTTPIQSVLKSPIASYVFVSESSDPEAIAQTIKTACVTPRQDFSHLFAALNQTFEEAIRSLLKDIS